MSTEGDMLKTLFPAMLEAEVGLYVARRRVTTIVRQMTLVEIHEVWDTTLRSITEDHYKRNDNAYDIIGQKKHRKDKRKGGEERWLVNSRNWLSYLRRHAKDYVAPTRKALADSSSENNSINVNPNVIGPIEIWDDGELNEEAVETVVLSLYSQVPESLLDRLVQKAKRRKHAS